ncbi:sensor histidine kinase [Kitasatospora sp. NPDC101183]|uniref:sensor histidine kinase n=1 Tax=Kitasatospora sp. NPDC101183 TaxID=3364100 RepID=UPI003808CCD7
MDAIARAWKKAVRTALPGPWSRRRIVGETVLALVLGATATALELLARTGPAVPIGIATALLCVLRRAFPASVLLAVATIGGYALGPFPLLILAGWTAGSRIRRVSVLAGTFVLGWVLFTVTGTLKDGAAVSPKLIIGLSLGTFLLLTVLPALWGRYRAQRRELTDALRERNQQLVRERVMVVHQARLRERHRIAQDMHDSLGHQLALISVHSGALEVDRTLNDRQREAVGVLRQAAVAAMRELREVVGVLHDESTAVTPVPLPTPSAGGVDGITALVDASRAAGAQVALTAEGERRPLAAAVDHAAYRIVQEALTNAHKHAPGAPIAVALRYEPDALVVEVCNTRAPELAGVRAGAHAPVSGGQGLAGLRERARLVGGMVHAGPTPEQGFRLAAVLPYEGAEAEGAAAASSDLDDWVLAGLTAEDEPAGRRRSPALGCAVGVVGVGAAVLGLLVWGVVSFIQGTSDATVRLPVYEEITVGMPEASVLDRLPRGNDFFTGDYRGSGPDRPEGAHCRWYLSGQDSEKWSEQNVMRFCFRDGVLVEKLNYPVRD